MTLSEFLDGLRGVKKCGNGWEAKCPAHDDKTASLSVSTGAGDRILIRCHAGCPTEAIVAARGLEMSDLFAADSANKFKGERRVITTYDYRDESASLLFQCVRFSPKGFLQRRPNADKPTEWIWNLNGIRRVLYRLPELKTALASGVPIYVVEGEKDCDALRSVGLAATCNPMGAGKWLPEHTETLRGAASVVVIADKDEKGRKHAKAVAAALRGVVHSLKLIELSDRGGKPVKDAHDFIAAGGTVEELAGIASNAPEFRIPDSASHSLPQARSLFDLERPSASDPSELLLYRYLCRGGGLLLCGATGIGKSSLAIQIMIHLAIGKTCFGIPPRGPLKSLLIQAENDDGDLAEMRDGILAKMPLNAEEREIARKNVIVLREQCLTGQNFFDKVARPALTVHRPDLLWIDPALAFLGGEVNSQKDVGAFLRNGLNPLLEEFRCGGVVIHHTNKPKGQSKKPEWQAGEFAYLGSGSSEWANWARAILVVYSIGSHEVFELRAAKRGERLKWTEADGKTATRVKRIAHANEPGVICWRELAPDEYPVLPDKQPKHTKADFLRFVPEEKPIPKKQLLQEANLTGGIGQKAADAYLTTLIAEGALHEWRRRRSGTNPEIFIARHPQPEVWH